MLRTALRPSNVGLLALMLAVAFVCGFLATWQWDRAQRGIEAEQQDDELAQAESVPLQSLIDPQETFTADAQTQPVFVEGHFDPERQFLVPDRVVDGSEATIILTAFVVPQDDGTEAVLPVARGWVSDESDPAVDAVPEGEVRIEGWLQVSEVSNVGRIDANHIGEISSPLLVNQWGGPIYTGYLAQENAPDPLAGQSLPDASPNPMARPETAHETGFNVQNLGYAVQWVVFGGFFVYLWWRYVRDQYLSERDAARARLLAADPEGDVARQSSDEAAAAGRETAAGESAGIGTATAAGRGAAAAESAGVGPAAGVGGAAGAPRGLGLLRLYQVIATVEGIALATMTVVMFVEYVLLGGETWFSTTSAALEQGAVIGWAIHGSLYMLYLAMSAFLWRRMRWPVTRLFLLALYGVLPFASFWFEHRVSRSLRAELTGANPPVAADGRGDSASPDGGPDSAPDADADADAPPGRPADRESVSSP